MMTDDDWARFKTWCETEAADIRDYAAALGESVEYRYLRRALTLWQMLQRDFPSAYVTMMDHVERECYGLTAPLNLYRINEYRTRWGHPALSAPPTLRLKEEHRVPMQELTPEQTDAYFRAALGQKKEGA